MNYDQRCTVVPIFISNPNAAMKAIILLATLKKEGLSNTEVLSEFLAEQLKKKGVESKIIKLVNHNIHTKC